jgi:radical SAM-linked protein
LGAGRASRSGSAAGCGQACGGAQAIAAPRPLTRFAQVEARRYRLRYTKLGQAAYLAHLDLVRHLPRIFRRAGLDIAYSHGFHPKPGLCFGPALGLGMSSLGELLDVKLSDELTPAELLHRLNAVSLTGIEFLAAAALQESEPALGRVLARAQYVVRLPEIAGGRHRRSG